MITAAREKNRMLEGSFGEVLWKVALEPERRTLVYRNDISAYAEVSVHALSPLTDKILIGIAE